MKLQNLRKAQGLPLNVIVIAVLVIIVMLVIIFIFTSQTGETSQTINDAQDGIGACKVGTLLIPSDKYDSVTLVEKTDDKAACADGYSQIFGAGVDNKICCAKKTTGTPAVTPEE